MPGEMLSPSLFAVDMGVLSSVFNANRIGRHISDAHCGIALQELINVCYYYSNRINL